MNASNLPRCALGVAAGLTILAGCSANGNTPQLGGNTATQSVRHDIQELNRTFAMTNVLHKGIPAGRRPLAHSWMRKPPKATTGTIWATDLEYGSVDMIAFPSGTLIGQVSGFEYPYGDCSDKAGNVYVADFDLEEGFEIQAGTTKVINSWPTGGESIGCSVSNAGDVAFTNFYPGGVKIVAGPDGGASYPGPGYDWPAGYDLHGNLFVECNYAAPCSNPSFAELLAGSSSWIFLNLKTAVNFPAAVQWMDKHLGVADQNLNSSNLTGIDLVKITGSQAIVIKTITLGGTGCSSYADVSASWGSVSKKPNGLTTKKIKFIIAGNLWCFPSPINVYKGKGGNPIDSIYVLTYQYDYGVTFTKP